MCESWVKRKETKRLKNGYQTEQACLSHYRIPYSSPLTLFTASSNTFLEMRRCLEMATLPVGRLSCGDDLRRCGHAHRLLEDIFATTRSTINDLGAVLHKKYIRYSQHIDLDIQKKIRTKSFGPNHST